MIRPRDIDTWRHRAGMVARRNKRTASRAAFDAIFYVEHPDSPRPYGPNVVVVSDTYSLPGFSWEA